MTGIEQTADVVVIGLGPGGEEVASRLADAGLTVVGVERELVGGECQYWGCIPSKMMVRAAETLAVTVVEGADRVLPAEEPEASAVIADVLAAEGLALRTGRRAVAFTHLAVYQARIATDDILGIPGFTADYAALPRVTFTDPEVGSVGLSESAARGGG